MWIAVWKSCATPRIKRGRQFKNLKTPRSKIGRYPSPPPPYFFAQSLERIGFRKTCGMVVDLLWKSRSGVACERASISILRGCGKYMCTLFENIIAIVFNDLQRSVEVQGLDNILGK